MFLFDQTEEDSAAIELTTQPNSYPLTHYTILFGGEGILQASLFYFKKKKSVSCISI